jgi:hypothetical protein
MAVGTARDLAKRTCEAGSLMPAHKVPEGELEGKDEGPLEGLQRELGRLSA